MPNLLAGACLQVRCPVWRLRLTEESTRAPDKRAQHTRATQRDRHARYHSSDRVGGPRSAPRRRPRSLLSYPSHVSLHKFLFVWRACCALLCGARVLSSVSRKRQTGQRTCRQAPSQEIKQAKSFADREAAKFWSKVPFLGG